MRAAKILVVDDSPTQLYWLAHVLAREGHAVRSAATGADAIREVRASPPDLVFLDWVLPDMDGLEVLRAVKALPEEQFIPVIMLSAKSDLDSRVAGLRIGADDFLAKPFAEAELLARAAAMLRIKTLQDELREAKRLLEEQSITDALTGLRNRRCFDERLREEFERARRYGDPLAVLMIDLDHFKDVNDRYGHPVGDVVLRETAALLRISTRDPDTCARFGGEEFAVILPKTHVIGATTVAERIRSEMGAKVHAHPAPGAGAGELREFSVTPSIGVAVYPSDGITTPEALLGAADEALYAAKRAGRNTIRCAPAPADPGGAAPR
ncbi:MAG TPA: diguanylate cyclase [Anaeromyxobacteraceae bacterium]|nr:diguanylate cyclase [Anaeromyxobacteraceae bacterium]